MASSVKGNNVFLIRALEKILGDKETKRPNNQQLKKACEEALSKSRPPIMFNNFITRCIIKEI